MHPGSLYNNKLFPFEKMPKGSAGDGGAALPADFKPLCAMLASAEVVYSTTRVEE